MKTISREQALQDFAGLLAAAQRQPVIIGDGGDAVAMISMSDYQALHGLKAEKFQLLCDSIAAEAKRRGMTAERFAELMADES